MMVYRRWERELLGRLRARYEKALEPLGRTLGRTGVSPGVLTTLSLATSCLAAIAFVFKSPILGGSGLIASAFLDMLDGAVARSTRSVTRFGAVYDHVLDRYAEFVILVGMGLGEFVDWVWIVFCLSGMMMASFVRAKAESVGGVKSCTVGIAERQEKLLILLAGAFAQPMISQSLLASVIVVGLLSHITAFQRLHYTYTQTRRMRA